MLEILFKKCAIFHSSAVKTKKPNCRRKRCEQGQTETIAVAASADSVVLCVVVSVSLLAFSGDNVALQHSIVFPTLSSTYSHSHVFQSLKRMEL